MSEHSSVTNFAVYENNVMGLVNWLVSWLDSGTPTWCTYSKSHELAPLINTFFIRARTQQ